MKEAAKAAMASPVGEEDQGKEKPRKKRKLDQLLRSLQEAGFHSPAGCHPCRLLEMGEVVVEEDKLKKIWAEWKREEEESKAQKERDQDLLEWKKWRLQQMEETKARETQQLVREMVTKALEPKTQAPQQAPSPASRAARLAKTYMNPYVKRW